MDQIAGNLKFIRVTVLAVAGSFIARITHLEFEEIFLLGCLGIAFLLFYDISTIIKISYNTYCKIKYRKNKRKQKACPKTDIAKLELPKKKKLSIRERIKTFPKVLLLSVFGLRKFANKYKSKIEFKLGKKTFKIPWIIFWTIKSVLINIVILLFLFTTFRKQFTEYPQYTAIFPEEDGIWNDYTRPIEIEFNIPIDEEALRINMAPEDTGGEWKFEKALPFLPFTRRVKFYPTETIFPEQKIMVYFTNLTNHFHTRNGGEHLVTYTSISLPIIEKAAPQNKAVDVPIDQEIILSLNQKDGPYVDWEFVFEKGLKYEVIRDGSRTVKIHFEKKLKQGKKYKFEIYQVPLSSNIETGEVIKKGEKIQVDTMEFTTVKAPLIESFQPEGTGIMINSVIKVVFEADMDHDSVEAAFSVNPEIEGKISWEDDRTFIFTASKDLPKETHYEVMFKKGIRSVIGGESEEDISFTFDTIGRVTVVAWNPGNGSGGVRITTAINVTFNQQVDHASAQGKFSISPNVSGSFSWNGNTMIYKPSANLGYSTTYTVTIASGVKTVHGLDSNRNFTASFTTESNIFILNVPQYYQGHAFTCNVTAAAMALSFKGAASSEMGVYNGVAKDNTACQKSGDTITYWGNPNVGYVGDINGGGNCGGYGVYWNPIANYANSRGVSAQAYTNWNYVSLAQEVEKGNPVVVWWQNGWANAAYPSKSWNTPSGQSRGVNGMHSEVVVGFIGPSSNPSHIITNDPWRGRRTHTVGGFNGLWGSYPLGGGSVRNAVVFR